MRYTYEFKKKAVELYRQGKWIDAPNDIINLKNFHDMIVRWHHLEESNTSDCLKHCGTNKKWSPEEKYELVWRSSKERGTELKYGSDVQYSLMNDIQISSKQIWTVPDSFTGTITGTEIEENEIPTLYDKNTDTIYIYNPYQLMVLV